MVVTTEETAKRSGIQDAMTEDELMSGYRKVKVYVPQNYSRDVKKDDDGAISLRIYQPRAIDIKDVDELTMQLYSRLLQKTNPDGTSSYLTRIQIDKILEQRGIWTDAEKARYDKMSTMIDTIARELRDIEIKRDNIISQMQNDPHASRKKLQNKLNDIDKERLDAIERFNTIWEKRRDFAMQREAMLSQSIETLVDTERIRQLALRLVKYDDDSGRCFWTSEKEFNNEPAMVINQIITKANYFWNGLDESFFEQSPVEAIFNSDGNTVKKREAPSSEAPKAQKT